MDPRGQLVPSSGRSGATGSVPALNERYICPLNGYALTREVNWQDFGCLVTPNLTVGEVLQRDKRRAPGPNSGDVRGLRHVNQNVPR